MHVSINMQAVCMQGRRSNADRSEETRRALVEAGRALFLEKGYAATGTPEVVERAGLTRGALYHHFKDKQALFFAVVEAEARRIADEIEAGAADAGSPLAALAQGSRAYLTAMNAAGRLRLMLLDGPAVLGPETMRQIDLTTGGRELRLGIAAALGPDVPLARIDALADLLSAMFERAVIAGSSGADPDLYAQTIDDLLAMLQDRKWSSATAKC